MSLFQDSHIRGLFFLVALILFINQVKALDDREVIALKEMQAEWNPIEWTGSPSCSWYGITCDPEGNVIQLYVHLSSMKHHKSNSLSLSIQISLLSCVAIMFKNSLR